MGNRLKNKIKMDNNLISRNLEAMKKTAIILSVLTLTIMPIKAQETVTVTVADNEYKYAGELRVNTVSEIFIQEQAGITFRNRDVYTVKLDEKSAQIIGKQTIEITLINDANFHCLSKGSTLEIFPFKDIYYCRNCNPQDELGQAVQRSFRAKEREIIRLLEYATDTLKSGCEIDSRYTPLLIKNLSNDNEIYIPYSEHGDGLKHIKLLGVTIKKKPFIWNETHYESVRMSDFVRMRLSQIFSLKRLDWSFGCLSADASAKEWQRWYDELLKK